MRRVFRLTTVLLVVLAWVMVTVPAQERFPSDLPSAAAGETGELSYDFIDSGVLTVRTIRDRSGKVVREAGYLVTLRGNPPFPEKDLQVQSVKVYYYDAAGRVDHIAYWWFKTPAPSFEYYAYDSSGQLARKWFVTAEGVRRYEIRFKGSQQLGELYFDDTGKYLKAVRGHLAPDIDLPHGWGPASGGLACGIALSTERGPFNTIRVWVNIKNVSAAKVILPMLDLPTFELRDAQGKVTSREPWFKQRPTFMNNTSHTNSQLLEEAEAGFCSPEYPLGNFFDPLPPGKYTLRVRQPIPERGVTLVSNEVTFVVL
ncbi:MAG TPA: hypothetical protein VE961_05310 [Pyrinomonadaceae bacterium]|nr:hypothetical protein [Pyrinomonadaceae bacterium]